MDEREATFSALRQIFDVTGAVDTDDDWKKSQRADYIVSHIRTLYIDSCSHTIIEALKKLKER